LCLYILPSFGGFFQVAVIADVIPIVYYCLVIVLKLFILCDYEHESGFDGEVDGIFVDDTSSTVGEVKTSDLPQI
jgi:hypothetical protein